MKTFEDFKKAVESGELSEKLDKLTVENAPKTSDERTELLVKFAKENGYEVSAEDFALADADMRELDENELEKMHAGFAGGRQVGGREDCVADYVCDTMWNTCVVSDECMHADVCKDNLGCSRNYVCNCYG